MSRSHACQRDVHAIHGNGACLACLALLKSEAHFGRDGVVGRRNAAVLPAQ
jgi:hypothetical protein